MKKLLLLLVLLAPTSAFAQCVVGPLQAANNLSDVCNAATARASIGAGTGSVTSVATGTGLTGGTITSTGTISLGSISNGTILGNSSGSSASPTAQTIGTGLSLSGGTLTATGSGGTVTSVSAGTGMSFSTITGTGSVAASFNTLTSAIEFVIDGAGSALTTSTCSFTSGQLCVLEVPYACTITAARLLADQTGSVVIEVAKTTYSSYAPGTHPVSGDKITASAPPTISSAAKSQDTTLTGWTTSVTAGDILGFSVTSATTITRVTISLTCAKT